MGSGTASAIQGEQKHPQISPSLLSAGQTLPPSGCLPKTHGFLEPILGDWSQENAAKHVCAGMESAWWPW